MIKYMLVGAVVLCAFGCDDKKADEGASVTAPAVNIEVAGDEAAGATKDEAGGARVEAKGDEQGGSRVEIVGDQQGGKITVEGRDGSKVEVSSD